MAFAVSNGQIQSISRPVYQARTSVRLSDDRTAAYDAIYRTHSSVQTVVSFLARNIASLGLHTFERISDTDRRRVSDHPFVSMLGRPNSRTTTYRLLRSLVADRAVYDAAYWLKFMEDGRPSLQRLSPMICKPGGKEDWLHPEYFEVTGSRGTTKLDPERVVYFRGYNPAGDLEGVSPIESLRQVLAEEFAAHEMRDQVLRNGARASGYIERPAGSQWGDAAFNRFKDDWRAQYAGTGPEAGGTPILEDGMKFVSASMTAKDLQYVEVRKLSREEVASSYHIPPPMVGLLDHATFSNITEQHKMLYQDTLGPHLEELQQEIELQLLHTADFSGTDQMYVEFNMAEKLKGSFEEQASALQTMVGAPVLTRNEGRARLNLTSIEGGDKLVTPLNVLIGGQASPSDSAPSSASAPRIPSKAITAGGIRLKAGATQPQRDKAAQVLAKFYARQEKSVRSALGAKAADDWWDEKRWNEELAAELYAVAFHVSKQVASSTLDQLGIAPSEYDPDMTLHYLQAVAKNTAVSINTVTKQKLDEALAAAEPMDEVTHVFEVAKETRSKQGGDALVTGLAGWASVEAVKQTAGQREATKTWIVTSSNPRPTHAQMSGETVALDDVFSNGGKWPGDIVLGVDECAGCTCDVEITFP